ncbi:hypothetical protein AB0M97_17965 [Streptomyces sp. NPDC051207]|uniref:hypothetical protein n=1 Tax=Streptomyces sp. NPDC051207 TaxID=3154641 RepID=UPI00342298ED
MRIRATVAAVTGALALSALVVPAAQADEAPTFRESAAAAFASAHGTSGKAAFSTSEAADLGITFSNFKIAPAIKVGTTNQVTTTVTYTLTHGGEIDVNAEDFDTGPYIYRGSFDTPDNMLFGVYAATCTDTSATTASCKGDIDVFPAEGELLNAHAGTWKGGAIALNYTTGDYSDQGNLGTTRVQRYSKLTVNASPEPVRKGKTITVTGKLSRANWETGDYRGYTNQDVKLQFRKAGSSTYTTLKTIKSNSTGNLSTTVTASSDGYFRYAFAGTTTTPAVNAKGDFVDVQ